MNPQYAEQTIKALLDLGTLKGVKVEYENTSSVVSFFKAIDNVIYMLSESSMWTAEINDYKNIKSIEPILMEPKPLEVGTRVKVIGGRAKGENGVILNNLNPYYEVASGDKYGDIAVAHHHVIPESLLGEDECKHEYVDEIASLKSTTYCCSNCKLDITNEIIEAVKQAGYQFK